MSININYTLIVLTLPISAWCCLLKCCLWKLTSNHTLEKLQINLYSPHTRTPVAYLEPGQTSKMELFCKNSLTIVVSYSLKVDVWLGSQYVSERYNILVPRLSQNISSKKNRKNESLSVKVFHGKAHLKSSYNLQKKPPRNR